MSDLPILDELGRDLSAAFRREERAVAIPRPRRVRQLVLATAALLAVVPAAVATRDLWGPDVRSGAPGFPLQGRPIDIAEGSTASANWRISAYMSPQGLCWQVAEFTALESFGHSTSCLHHARSREGWIAAGGRYGAHEALLVGWAPPAAARVVIETGDRRHVAQIVSAPPDRVERAGLPTGLKFYVASLRGVGMEDPPATVVFDESGRELERFPPPRR